MDVRDDVRSNWNGSPVALHADLIVVGKWARIEDAHCAFGR